MLCRKAGREMGALARFSNVFNQHTTMLLMQNFILSHFLCRSVVYCLGTGAPNSAKFRGGCRGPAKIRQRGCCNNLFTFHTTKYHFLGIKKGLLLRILHNKKVHFLEFLRKAIKKDSHLRIFTL